MTPLTLRAHFDGERVLFDEPLPFSLKPNTKLVITVLAQEPKEDEREAWMRLSQQGLARAYGENEPEYTLDMIKKPNPAYARR